MYLNALLYLQHLINGYLGTTRYDRYGYDIPNDNHGVTNGQNTTLNGLHHSLRKAASIKRECVASVEDPRGFVE
jgi:hypothetical protein